MSLRPIRANEIEELVTMCAEHADFEKAAFTLDGQHERLEKVIFESPARLFVWVVELDSRLAGFAAASLEYSTWNAREYLHLDCLYLRPAARGQGWGSKLLNALAEHARQHDCREMQWQTPEWNERAVAFYHAKGATSRSKLRFTWPLSPQA